MLIPFPTELRPGSGDFLLTEQTPVTAPPALRVIATWLRAVLGSSTGNVSVPDEHEPAVSLALSNDLPPEHYRLSVSAAGVRIVGGDEAGVFYGAQTLRQLLPSSMLRCAPIRTGPWAVPTVEIVDGPRFAWRGVLLDVARHYLPKREIMRMIDLMALHKLNVLQLHLTDDQGWRLEIRKYPRLTEVGSWRTKSPVGARQHRLYDERPHGGFYTQDDIREIVAYAHSRHVRVVPEIDVPGHSRAAIAAYPELGNCESPIAVGTDWGVESHVLNVEESTVEFFLEVLAEVLELFPGEYICIGGDECPKEEWRTSPRAQQRMRQLGLTTEDELQSWFVGRMADFVDGHGRKLCGWDEIIEGGLAPGATVLSWRGNHGAVAAARSGHDTVTSPRTEVYLDLRQSDEGDEPVPIGSVVSLADVYAFEPIPQELTGAAADRVIGAMAGLWTEHIDDVRLLDYMAFPRLAAFAEAVWSTAGRDFDHFRSRMHKHERRLDALGVEYRPEGGPHPWQTRPDAPGWPEERADLEAQYAEETANLV